MTVWQALGTMFLGRALAQTFGDTSWLGSMRDVIESFREQGFRLYPTLFPSLLAQVEAAAACAPELSAETDEDTSRLEHEALNQMFSVARHV